MLHVMNRQPEKSGADAGVAKRQVASSPHASILIARPDSRHRFNFPTGISGRRPMAAYNDSPASAVTPSTPV
jgi:hypothetical protein